MSKIIYNLVYNRKRSLNKKGMALVQVEAYLDRNLKSATIIQYTIKGRFMSR